MNKPHTPHVGMQPVSVGQYTILAGGLQDLVSCPVWPASIIVPLTDKELPPQANSLAVVPLYLPDFGGVPSDWEHQLADVVELIAECTSVMAFCMAGHGRTGTLLASLIALLEDERVTPDPIAAVRERHCTFAVESVAQGEAIFALRGQPLPRKYQKKLWVPPPMKMVVGRKS